MQTALHTQAQSIESYLQGGTVQARHLAEVGEPIRALVVSSRHGIGGAITDNAHLIPIRAALGDGAEMHAVGASALAFENLGVQFHRDCIAKRDGAGTLDPLTYAEPERIRAVIERVRPHVVLFLDNPERRPFMGDTPLTPEYLKSLGARCVVAASKSVDVSGFAAIKEVEIRGDAGRECVDLYPGTPTDKMRDAANVYLESDLLARLFGGKGEPAQRVLLEEKQLAREKLAALGVRDGDKVVYVHGGSSTPLKEFTPAQSSELIRRCRRELARAGVDLSALVFVVSPEPRDRPETAAAIRRGVELLGGRAVEAPYGTFGLLRGLIARADGVVCADTGAGHLATALGVPCATIFGNPDPAVPVSLWGPDALRRSIPNTVATRLHSGTALAHERFAERAGHSAEQMSDAEFAVSLIVAAAIEGWGAGNRKV